MFKKIIYSLVFVVLVLASASFVLAAEPTGGDWYQLLTDHQTGSDNTGDGGTGNVSDLNYYYVGQTFNTNIQINSNTGTNASNIWVDYDASKLAVSGLQTGSFFPNWTGQSISAGRIKSTGYRTSGYSTGAGSFGNISFTAIAPSEADYSMASPATININTGVVGNTTESNISRDGLDVLDSAENFRLHIWADTVAPYAKSPSPSNSTSGVNIDSDYVFELHDSRFGEINDGGVGTGVNVSSGTISLDDGGGAVNYNGNSFFNCSGTWGTNLCNVTVNPTSPSGISGDQRNWDYNTSYTVDVSGFRDLASSNQGQLGDLNGPNTMDTKTWTFVTEADNIAPRLTGGSPTGGSSNVNVNTDVTFDVLDKKIYTSPISGTGINPSSCRVNISSWSFPMTTFQQGQAGVDVQQIDYGYRFRITPSMAFGQNETVSVSVYDCTDLAGNVMATDNYTFSTRDNDAPYVDSLNPATYINPNGNIGFKVKDSGVGVDLDNTVIYIKGVYYTKNGGSGVVTTTGTRIVFDNSLSFLGSNYWGDTTSVSGNSGEYTFLVNPENDFADEEPVPIIIYSQDLSGNLMNNYVYALGVGVGGYDGQSYCGTNTTWDGAKCTGRSCGGGSYSLPPQGSSYCGANTIWDNGPSLCVGNFSPQNYCGEGTIWDSLKCVSDNVQTKTEIYNPSIVQVDETSVLVTWFTTKNGSAKVLYGKNSIAGLSGYSDFLAENSDNSIYHSVVINGLVSGSVYYFRPVSKIADKYVYGPELKMAPKFVSEVKEVIKEVVKEVVVEKQIAGTCEPTQGGNATGGGVTTTVPEGEMKVGNITMSGGNISFGGYARPFSKIKIIIYRDE